MTPPGVSVIIPTLGEATRIVGLVDCLQAEPERAEIIVVDGGSSDATIANAAAHGARVLCSPRGRGEQLRAGAAAASGDILLFLHADSVFPPRGLAAITRALAADPAAPGGNFRLVFDGDSEFARWLTGFYAWLRRRGLYYGDSGIFVRREVYFALGGIRPLAVMAPAAPSASLTRRSLPRRANSPGAARRRSLPAGCSSMASTISASRRACSGGFTTGTGTMASPVGEPRSAKRRRSGNQPSSRYG